MSQYAVTCRKYAFSQRLSKKIHSGVPNPLAHGVQYEDPIAHTNRPADFRRRKML
jgi:hypothetical protein